MPDDADANRLGRSIKDRRLHLGLRQREVGKHLGVTSLFIGLVESGKRRIGLTHLPKLAQILKMEPKTVMYQWLWDECPDLWIMLTTPGSPEDKEAAEKSTGEIAFLYTQLEPADKDLVLIIARRLAGGLS